jgi:hypothetical protein
MPPPIELASKDSTVTYTPRLSGPARPRFRKSYQACEHCRQRKARCVPEEPRDETASVVCVRCRRERKKCVFRAERSVKATYGRIANTASTPGRTSRVHCMCRFLIVTERVADVSHSWTSWPDARPISEPNVTNNLSPSPSPGHPPTLISGPSPAGKSSPRTFLSLPTGNGNK